MSRVGLIVSFVCALLFVPEGVLAQAAGRAKVTGTVSDSSGAAISSAQVVLLNNAANVTRTQQTDSAGEFIFVDVEPGEYKITVTKQGFQQAEVSSLNVQVAKSHLVNVVMQLGSVTERVEVTATANVELQTADATVGNVIGGSTLLYLPNPSRDATTLLQLQPLVSPARGVGQDFGGGVAGTRSDQSTLILDGGDATPSTEGTGGYTTSRFGADVQGVVPTPADSVEEFRVGTTNPNANFGRSAGGQVYLVSKRGTNDIHGSAYWYHQNDELNANTWIRNSLGQPNPEAKQNRFGASAGGPILKDKLFIFGLYEGWRFPHSADILRLVPTDSLKAGTLRFHDASGNVVSYPLATSTQCGATGVVACDPRSLGISPVIQSIWKLMPPGNDPTSGDGLNTIGFRAPAAVPFVSNFGMARLDYNITPKWTAFTTFRYYVQHSPITQQIDIAGVASHQPGKAVATAINSAQPRYFVYGVTGQITPRVINTFNVTWERNWWKWDRVTPAAIVSGTDAALAVTGQAVNRFVDQPINVDTGSARQRTWNSKIWMFRDDITWVKARHTLSFGGSFRHDFSFHTRDDKLTALAALVGQVTAGSGVVISNANRPPTCTATVTANCLVPRDQTEWNVLYAATLGLMDQTGVVRTRNAALNLNPPGVPLSVNVTMDAYEGYVNDIWRVKPTLSITLGLNYGVQLPPTDSNGLQSIMLDPGTGKPWTARNYFSEFNQAQQSGTFFAPNLAWEPIKATGLKYPYRVDWNDWGPRIAVAWNPAPNNGWLAHILGNRKTVIRGGYARIFDRINDVNSVMVPGLFGVGFQQAVTCRSPDTQGICRGFGGTTPTTAFRIGPDGSTVPTLSVPATATPPLIPNVNSSFESYLDIMDYDFKPGRNNAFDLTVQRELPGNMLLEVGYVGRRASHLYQTLDFTQVPIFMKDKISGQTFAQAYDAVATALRNGTAVTAQPWFEDMTGAGSTLALANTFTTQFINGAVHDLWDGGITPRLPQPASNLQVGTGQWVGDFGRANYDAGFVTLHKRTSHGLAFDINYTLSHSLDQIGLDQLDTGSPSYSSNLNYDYGPSLWDRRHTLNFFWVYELPLGHGHRGSTGNRFDNVIGGWFWSGIFSAASGLPITVIQGACQEFGDSAGSQCANAIPLRSIASFDTGVHRGVTGSGGVGTSGHINFFSDPKAVFDSFRPILLSQDTRARDPGVLRGLPRWNLDLSVGKQTKVSERVRLTFTFDFFNALNHMEFADPTLNLTRPSLFGVLNNQYGTRPIDNSASRAIQFGLRASF